MWAVGPSEFQADINHIRLAYFQLFIMPEEGPVVCEIACKTVLPGCEYEYCYIQVYGVKFCFTQLPPVR